MQPTPIRIVQISDMHLLADEEPLLGVNTTESYKAVLQAIKSDAVAPDLLLLTGDISQDETPASYIKIAEALTLLEAPAYYIRGNHDDHAAMASVYPRDTILEDKHIVLPHWHLILLQSQKPNAVEGYLESSQLTFLEDCLQVYPERHAIVVFHHHPIEIASRWADEIGLQNADALWSVLANYPAVKAILFGHIHQQFESNKNGIACYSAPSTCFQFKPKAEKFGLDPLSQGYRWLNLHADGHIETGVTRLPEYVGLFEEEARGY
jgi:Icc protein